MIKCNEKINNPVKFFGLKIVDRFGDCEIIDASSLLHNSLFSVNDRKHNLFIGDKQFIEIVFCELRYYAYVEDLVHNLDKLSLLQKIDFVKACRFEKLEATADKKTCVLFLECVYNTVKHYIDIYMTNNSEPDFDEGEELDCVRHDDGGGYVKYARLSNVKDKQHIMACSNELFEEVMGEFLPYADDIDDVAMQFGVNLIKDHAQRVWQSYKIV